eukprot:gene5163-5815_t
MYRACRWTASASRTIQESSRRPPDGNLFAKIHRINNLELRRGNAISAGFKAVSLLKVIGSGLLAAGATVGATIFYAGRDEKIRLEIEDKIPQSRTVFTSIYGDHKKQSTSDSESDSLLPLNKKLQKLSDLSTDQEQHLEKLDVAKENLESKTQDAEKKEKPQRDNFVVITTIDDQSAVSSIDLDIGNAPSPRNEKKVKMSKKEKKDKQAKSKPEENKVEDIIENKTESTAAVVGVGKIPIEGVESASETEKLVHLDTPASLEAVTDVQPLPEPEKDQESAVKVDEQIESETTVSSKDEAPQVVALEVIEPVAIVEPFEIIEPVEVVAEEELSKEDINRLGEIMGSTSMDVFIQTYVDKLELMRDMALEKQTKASSHVRDYMVQLDKALKTSADDEAFDDVWKETSNLEHASQLMVDEAKQFEMKMQANIEELHEMIQAAKRNGISKIAEEAQQAVNSASLDLQKATADVKKACDELSALSMADVKANMEEAFSELVDTASLSEGGDSVESQLPVKDVMMAYAMKKIEYLKGAIESVKQEEKERTEALLKLALEEEEGRTQTRLQAEAERLQRNFEIESELKKAELVGNYENEMKKQLKRQSAAHREHLNDVLQTQATQLSQEHQKELEKELTNQKHLHVEELAQVSAHLKGVESMIESVVDVETKNRKTRELWLAVQSLGSVLNDDVSNEENHPNVQLVLSTIPETALVQGVTTEEELKKRFVGVKSVCKRVAMVGEKQGSLWTYALSAIRSLLVIETSARHDTTKDIDPDTISTYDILAKAQSCVENGDLELAVKFMSLLKGVPRKLASDWLRETRSYLEAKIASDFLMAYVSSEGTFECS